MLDYIYMQKRKIKVVQTELPLDLYGEFQEIARRENKKIKNAAREAIAEYVADKRKFEANDPLFSMKPVDYKDEKASEDIDKILYG